MTAFWLGVGSVLTLSFVVNMFDADFREAMGRAALGLLAGPLFMVALLLDRSGWLKGRKISPSGLARFAQTGRVRESWSFAHYSYGVLVLRAPKKRA